MGRSSATGPLLARAWVAGGWLPGLALAVCARLSSALSRRCGGRFEGAPMFARIRSKLTYANVVATLALFLALGGGAYAAFKLPKNSVGSKQIKKNAVNSSKVANGSLLAGDFKAGQVPAGKPGPPGQPGTPGDPGSPGPPAKSFDGTVAQGGQNV